jgi:hypothetical protein
VATEAEIAQLRDLIAEPDGSNGWTDEKISDYIDRALSVNGAASAVWGAKAAGYATAVDVSESGSSRKLSDLFSNAIKLRDFYKGLEDIEFPPVVPDDYPIIRQIRRVR